MKLPLILCSTVILIACSAEPNNNTLPVDLPVIEPVANDPNNLNTSIGLIHAKEWCETQQTAETVEFCECINEEGAKMDDCSLAVDTILFPKFK